MFCCLRDPDTNVMCKSSVIPLIYNEKLYQWDQHLALDGFDCDLELEFYLEVGLFVERVIIVRTDLIYESEYRRTTPLGPSLVDPYHRILKIGPNVSINYIVRKYDTLSQIHIYFVAWKVSPELIAKILSERGHKITASIDSTYLGRPQLIYTREDRRTHTWLAVEETLAFEGIPPRGDYGSIVEETRDLIILKWEVPPHYISPRAVTQQTPPQWDHDHFSNPVRRLPHVQRCENVMLQFYNFRFMPPTRLKCLIRWGKFVAAHLRASSIINVTIEPDLHVFLRFIMHAQHAEIIELSFTATSLARLSLH